MFERFSERARRVVFYARLEVTMHGGAEITARDVLAGIVREAPLIVERALGSSEALERLQSALAAEEIGGEERPESSADVPLSMGAKRMLARAADEADRAGASGIQSVHLLAGCLSLEQDPAADALRAEGLQLGALREHIQDSELQDEYDQPPEIPPDVYGY